MRTPQPKYGWWGQTPSMDDQEEEKETPKSLKGFRLGQKVTRDHYSLWGRGELVKGPWLLKGHVAWAVKWSTNNGTTVTYESHLSPAS